MLFSVNPEWVFWMGSAAALLLLVLVAIAKPQASQTAQVMDSLGANRPSVDLKTAVRMFPAQNVDVYSVRYRRRLRI
jgi:OHS family lactose permease-like MFS transporter